MPGFGWKKDPRDPRDYLFPTPFVTIPEEVKNINILPKRRNQLNEGSCVGHGVGIQATALSIQQKVYVEWFGPRWIYNGAKWLGGYLQEEGAYPRDAFEFLRKYGCLLEHFWPYIANKDSFMSPMDLSLAIRNEALKRPVLKYYRVVDGIDGLCQCLATQSSIVSVGSPWCDRWMRTDPNGLLVIPTEQDQVGGGHETALYGYNIKKKVFYGANSWGEGWSPIGGDFLLPFEAIPWFKNKGGYDAHYMIVEWSGEPPVPPQPKPSLECQFLKALDAVIEARKKAIGCS